MNAKFGLEMLLTRNRCYYKLLSSSLYKRACSCTIYFKPLVFLLFALGWIVMNRKFLLHWNRADVIEISNLNKAVSHWNTNVIVSKLGSI